MFKWIRSVVDYLMAPDKNPKTAVILPKSNDPESVVGSGVPANQRLVDQYFSNDHEPVGYVGLGNKFVDEDNNPGMVVPIK